MEIHRRIAARLEPVEELAADELREAYELMRQVDVDAAPASSARAVFVTLAALEYVLDSRPLPPFIVEWCDLAVKEMHATSRALRGSDLPPTISVPGFTAKEWRERHAKRAFAGLSARQIARFDAALVRT